MKENVVIVFTTGMASRELFELREKNDVNETEGPQPTASEVPSVVPEPQTTEAPADAGSTDASYAGDSI